MSSPNSSLNGWTVVIPQSMVEKVLKRRVDEILEEVRPEGSLLNEDIPLFEEETTSRGIGPLILIGAIVASLLIFTGLQVADSHAPATLGEVAVSSGVQTMSAAELIQTVKSGNRTVYWLAPKQGDGYTINNTSVGIDQISYRPEGSNVSNLKQFDVIVGTYQDFSTYDAQPHPLMGGNSRTTTLLSGATITYNAASPDRAVVAFPNKPEIVVLNYPAVQSVPTLLNDAQKLVPVS